MSGAELARKRPRDPDSYQANIRKKARLCGAAYQNAAGHPVPSKKPGPDCNCKRRCFARVTPEDRQVLFDSFYNMSTENEQDLYLQSQLLSESIERRRPRNEDREDQRERRHAIQYSVSNGEKRFEACKAAMLSIFALNEKRLRRITDLLREGRTPVEGRGGAHHTIPGDRAMLVDLHIRSFPVKETHYGPTGVKYLDARLNITNKESVTLDPNRLR